MQLVAAFALTAPCSW